MKRYVLLIMFLFCFQTINTADNVAWDWKKSICTIQTEMTPDNPYGYYSDSDRREDNIAIALPFIFVCASLVYCRDSLNFNGLKSRLRPKKPVLVTKQVKPTTAKKFQKRIDVLPVPTARKVPFDFIFEGLESKRKSSKLLNSKEEKREKKKANKELLARQKKNKQENMIKQYGNTDNLFGRFP